VLSFPEVFGLCFCSGVCSTFAAVFTALGLVCVLFPVAGCIPFPLAVVLPVIAKGENPGVCAVKYRYFSSSLNRLVGS